MQSQFAFVHRQFPTIFDAALRAEVSANSDPRTSCFYSRRTLELIVSWTFENDSTLTLPYREDLSALIHESSFRNLVGQAIFYKCRAIKDLGNQAVHSQKPISREDATSALRELFHVCYWLVRTYAKGEKPDPGISFDPSLLPVTTTVPKQTLKQLQSLNQELEGERQRVTEILAAKENLDDELKRLRAEIAAIKKANEAKPDTHNYSEAETRDLFIDLLLREAGWLLQNKEDREYEVEGMPNEQGKGYIDYVLWGGDGKPLAVVEAKRTRRDAKVGQIQAKLYADCLEQKFGQRPIIFYTNGYDHWIWDDVTYPPRLVQGFYKASELELMIQRRQTRKSLVTAKIDDQIVERYYQTRAIRRIGESFEKDHARRALLVMATGAGKTRTVIALGDMLMRANWAKRILFLADRTALVNQACNAFKRHLTDVAPVNLVTEKNIDSRVCVSTYPTMLGLIDQIVDGERKFGPGHFDLVVIDEAHRSVFMKYRAIFDYFDSYLVGLTATPKEEVDRNTYSLFDLENGVPTDAYTLQQAVDDHYLVPAKAVAVPLRLPSTGIVYDDLSDEEKEQFELTDWKERAEDVLEGKRIEPAAVNQWLFNQDTVDKVLKHLMENGLKVDGGDKLGKTIIFAKNHDHAMFIAERFNAHYPKYAGHFAQVIDYQLEYSQTVIDNFSNPNRLPQIAISVDMLDTGIDVPEVVNLVFFKQVRSKTKFWQMVGRGTRLCPDLFGPGQDKEFFQIFDYCNNLDFFRANVDGTDGAAAASLSQRLFATRLKLLAAIASSSEGGRIVREHVARYGDEPETPEQLFEAVVALLKHEVASMNTENFIVRAKRRLVEKYQDPAQWLPLTDDKIAELEKEVAGLPTETESEKVESKRFDLLLLRLQLAALQGSQGFLKMRKEVQEIAAMLEEAAAIPLIRDQLPLIQDLQGDLWWEDVSITMLEMVRLRLRKLVPLVEHRKGSPVYTDFVDEMGDATEVDLPGFGASIGFERFKEKCRSFLRNHLDDPVVQKLRLNEPLTADDVAHLEDLIREPAAGDPDLLIQARQDSLGLFVRSLVGMDRSAAQAALAAAISEFSLSSNQIEFVNMVIDHLAEHGVLDVRSLYESPFVDKAPSGPEALLGYDLTDRLAESLAAVRATATS